MEVIKKYLLTNARLTKVGGVLIMALLVLGVFVPLTFADAFLHDKLVGVVLDGAGGFVLSLFAAILALIKSLAVLLAVVAGSLLHWVLNIGLFYTKCAKNISADECFIDVSWRMTRDFVNIALIIGIVVIAFFTIIGNQAYAAGKTLIPFIAVALFVNFSRVLVGVVVDISNLIMAAFIQALPNFGNINAAPRTEFSFSVEGGLIILVQNAVDVLFWLGMAFILALYAVIFMVRYGMIWMITILSPLAFAAYIFPSTKKFFTMWRDQLVQWSFIGVPVLFFLWIAVKFKEQIGKLNLVDTAAASSGVQGIINGTVPNLMSLLILIVAFMLGMKTGAMGSSMIINQGKKLGAAAGMATAKFSGRMAQRGVGAGAGAADRRFIKPGLEKIAPKIPIVKQWQPGYAKERYEKMRKAAIKGGAGSKAEKRFLNMQNKAGLKNVSKLAPWESLNDTQKGKVTESGRSKTAKRAAAFLGSGAKKAKRIASAPFSALTPEEQKALWSVVSAQRFRKAKKGEVQKAMKDYADKGLDDPKTLRKTIQKETNRNKRLAAQILLLQAGGDKQMDSKERTEIAKKAKAVGFGKEEIAPSLKRDGGTDEIASVYGPKGTPQYASAERAHVAGGARAVEEELKDIENLTESAARSLLQTATNIHTKMAAIRKLANDNTLRPDDFKGMEESLKSFGQLNNVLKRSLQFADPTQIPQIMAKMTPLEHMRIDPRIFDKGFEGQLNAWFKSLTVDAYRQIMKSLPLKQKLGDKILRGKGLTLSQNPAVEAYHDDEMGRKRAFNTIS